MANFDSLVNIGGSRLECVDRIHRENRGETLHRKVPANLYIPTQDPVSVRQQS